MVGTNRDARREAKSRKVETPLKPVTKVSATGKVKARKCIRCGHWIVKRKLFYNGRDVGEAWIHYRSSSGKMTPAQWEYVIDRCVAEPRPIPLKE